MQQTFITIKDAKNRVTVHVVNPVPVPINGAAEYRAAPNGVQFILADGTIVGIPLSNIVCIVTEKI